MKLARSVALGLAVTAAGLLVVVIVAAAGDALTSWWVALGLAVVMLVGLVAYRRLARRIPRRVILEFDLERGLVEQPAQSPIARAMAADAYVLRDLVDALERATSDSRVVGLVARLGGSGIGVARAQELAAAIAAFAASGRPSVAYAETLGEGGGERGLPEMLVGSVFDEFFLQPGGDLSIQGLELRGPFLRGLLNKLGVGVQFDHRREYKAAMYRLTEEEMPEPAREANQGVVDAQFGQLLAGIAAGRGLAEDAVRAAVDRAPLLAAEAAERGLVDGLHYGDEVMDRIDTGWGSGAKRMSVSTYLKRAGRSHRRGPTVGLVYGTGAIVRGKSRFEPLTRAPAMGSDDVAKAFRTAIDDKKVKAIVFRVDSPGGSANASGVIRREVDRAQEKGKPVIVSMGDVAGSGGYFVAATADAIVAQPGTITGSIGVLTGKFVTRDALARAGIRFDEVHAGENAGFGTPDREYTESEWERVQAQLDSIYDEFVRLVADGREMDRAAVEEIAKGRIWSGADAHALGLVDELGGLADAVRIAAGRAGIGDRFRVQVFPRPKSQAAALLARGREDGALDAVVEAMSPALELAGELRAVAGYGVLSIPGIMPRQ